MTIMFLISVKVSSEYSRPYGYVETEDNAKKFCNVANNMIADAIHKGEKSIVPFYGELYHFGDNDEFVYCAGIKRTAAM